MSLPALSEDLVRSGVESTAEVELPDTGVFDRPEKVLQFGSGRFLRGFVDYFLDEALANGLYDGRVVIVQSTGSERSKILQAQDGLFTVKGQGLQEGAPVVNHRVVGSVSRALPARQRWADVLKVARRPELEVVVSNTTEVGIRLDEGDTIDRNPPRSFPGKLTGCLYERYQALAPEEAGLTIIPCELIENNADRLREIVLTLAEQWQLGSSFREWVADTNTFCNSLVDRIVPGKPSEEELRERWETVGYRDQLFTEAELYRLWAIEGEPSMAERLGFLEADDGIHVVEDITPYRLRKVRILNGSHTISVPLAYLAGCETVYEMMDETDTSRFVRKAILDEIVPVIEIDPEEARQFAHDVLDRFRNPYISHRLIDITFQETTKMNTRVVPSIRRYYREFGRPPMHLCFGFAAYLLFMRVVDTRDGTDYGRRSANEVYPITDDHVSYFREQWDRVGSVDPGGVQRFVEEVAGHESFWDVNLSEFPGFCDLVANSLSRMLRDGVSEALEDFNRRVNRV